MLIAALLLWLGNLLGGGGADAAAVYLSGARDHVKAHVTDRADRKAAERVLDSLDQLRADIASRREAARKAVSKSLSDRDGDPGEELASLAADSTAFDLRLVELRFQLRDTMTRAQWQKVFPKPGTPGTPE